MNGSDWAGELNADLPQYDGDVGEQINDTLRHGYTWNGITVDMDRCDREERRLVSFVFGGRNGGESTHRHPCPAMVVQWDGTAWMAVEDDG